MTTTLTPTELDALLRGVVERLRADLAEPDFHDRWRHAPGWVKRTTEQESAEYWYQIGATDERGKMLSEQNADYLEMLRVGRERLSR